MDTTNKIRNAIEASIIGDCLGVPVQFSTRQELTLCSVKNMLGYGRFDQPEGTWSDDTSMILCTMESLSRGYDIEDLADTFCKWLFDAHWTPAGFVFDAGLTTFMALDSIRMEEKSARESGCKGEDDNGNGSLMRILPAALYFHQEPINTFLDHIHEISAITHAHPRSLIGCGIYSLLVKSLLETLDKDSAYKQTVEQALSYYNSIPTFKNELTHFMRVLSYEIPKLNIDEINSSGYIIDTLEASLWCFLRNSDTKSILLAAVNLGLDTDTTGTVAGGLAGLLYGLESIPTEWLNSIVRKSDIDILLNAFIERIQVTHKE